MAQLPKNIRQIGGREDRVKVYLEDYVSTYLRRVQELQEETGCAGLLVGSWQPPEPEGEGIPPSPLCAFVGGAMKLQKADLEGGRIYLSREAWDEGYEGLGAYFSGQELCGIFVCEGSCRRFRRQALFAAVREYFPEQDALLYLLTEDGEEIFYRISRKCEERLQGYYCYFERNEAMQEYMMDHLPDRRVEWEGQGTGYSSQYSSQYSPQKKSEEQIPPLSGTIPMKEGTLGDPADVFRQKMRHNKENLAPPQKSGRGIIGLCAAMAVVIFVSGMGIVYRERGGLQIQDLLKQLDIDPSRFVPVSGLPEETGERYQGSQSRPDDTGSSVVVEEIPGNVHPTEPTETEPPETEPPETEPPETEAAPLPTETSEEPSTEESRDQPVQEVTQPSTEPSAEESEISLPADAGVIYVVKAGDSLYSISRRFYGNEEMAQVIKEINGIENADLIKEGQELLLP